VPDVLEDEVVVPVNCAVSTVLQGLTSVGVSEGDYIVVQGAGGLGLSAVALARDMGADRVIAIDRLEPRLELARDFGATHTININEYDTPQARIDRVKELTDGRGADMVVELVGIASLLVEGVEMLHNAGAFLEIGNLGMGSVEFSPNSLLRGKGRRIYGAAMYKPMILPRSLDFLVRTRDRYPFHKMISHKFPLEKVNEAFAEAEWSNRQTAVVRACLVP
jgi:Zn-dependent alcohol dehydrogenase